MSVAVLVVARKVELGEFADRIFSLLRNCSKYCFIVDALSSHRYLFHHSDSVCLLLRRISAVFSWVSWYSFFAYGKFSLICCVQGESSIIAILSRPAFLRSILYVDAWPIMLPPVARKVSTSAKKIIWLTLNLIRDDYRDIVYFS